MDLTLGKISARLVDPDLRDFLKAWPFDDLDPDSLESTRAILQDMVDRLDPRKSEDDIVQEECQIPGNSERPGTRGLLYRPVRKALQKRPAVFHVHGGGLLTGAPELRSDRNIAVAERHDCVVISPAYRLAPETKHPGAIEDIYAAFRWLWEKSEDLGIDRENIVIVGESAGGGLAAALTMLIRDRGEFPIKGQILLYPMIDDRTGTVEARSDYLGEFIWTAAANRFAWESYLPCKPGSDEVSPYAAAARQGDFSGLPPTFVMTGALDLFLSENLDFVGRLTSAGVPVGLHVYPGAYHAFDRAGDTRIGRQFTDDFNRALQGLFQGDFGRH